MRKKKSAVVIICLLGSLTWAFSPPIPSVTYTGNYLADQASYDRRPPIVRNIYVQQLTSLRPDSSNLVMYIEYDTNKYYAPPPPTVKIFYADTAITFYDDGSPDDPDTSGKAGDGVYAAYLKEDIPVFLQEMQDAEAYRTSKESHLFFDHHFGTEIETSELTAFDFEQFGRNNKVTLPFSYQWRGKCGIVREKSLFITDLSVVQDPQRTYNPVSNHGTPGGVWTFGSMVKNIVNDPITPGAARNFLKEWVKNWVTTYPSLNGEIVYARPDALNDLIKPWIAAAGFDSPPPAGAPWDVQWDYCNEQNLLNKAPFRLTAIVNRIDLRENISYKKQVADAGETRFIFTLINLYDRTVQNGSISNYPNYAGEVPVESSQNTGSMPAPFVDWMGLNIILEYKNVQRDRCALVQHANAWKNLSNYNFGPGYNAALEALTTTVTAANALPTRTNGSALSQLRTNERLFHYVYTNDANGWKPSDWEFRQFELNGSGTLSLAPLSLTPKDAINALQDAINVPHDNFAEDAFNQWVYDPSNFYAILFGNYNIPNINNFLGISGKVQGDYAHFFSMRGEYPIANGPDRYKVRNTISVNTCQGCHAGNTKTAFTQISPVQENESAVYSGTVPAYKSNPRDFRFHTSATWYPVTAGELSDQSTLYNQIVSPFLTGRYYRGAAPNELPTWKSDASSQDDKTDPTLDGLYIVENPEALSGLSNSYKYSGFNDLLRRIFDLCDLSNMICKVTDIPIGQSHSKVMQISSLTQFYPFAHNAH